MHIRVSADERQAFARAATILRGLGQGLRATGSKKTVQAMDEYVATLEKVATAADAVDLTDGEKVQIEQASFLLEGSRDSLMNADFRDRAEIIQQDVDALGAIVVRYNTAASEG